MPPTALAPLPHVGRSVELSLLSDWLSDVQRGHGSVQLVAGQAGIGKTRLMKTVAERAERDKWSVAVGRVYTVESGVPYAVWSDALVALLRSMDTGTRNVLTRGGGWLGRICPAFAAEAAAPPDPDAQRDGKARLLWNFAQFLGRLAERQPLLLVLENLHLADSASLELLHFAARQISGARVAIAGTYNEAELDRSPGLRDMEQSLLALGAAKLLRLDALTQKDVEQLVIQTFSVDHPSAHQLARRLYAWTRGNPFFVEETLKSLVESGRLYQREGRWLGWEVEELDLPRSVRSAVSQRLQHLSADARQVAGAAAVIGAHVRFPLLHDASELPRDAVLASLDELVKCGILVETDHANGGDYDFAHPILQDVVYDALGPARARLLHSAIARSLEKQLGGDALAQADALAFHYSRADATADQGKAALYLAAAGRDALARHADRAAADYLSAALERQPRSADAHTLIDDLAQARQRLGDYDGAMALWQRARADAESAGNSSRSARIERRMGLACYWSGRFEEALAHFDAALASAAAAGDERQRAQIQISRGACWQSLGRPAEAEHDLADALATAERIADGALLGRAHRALLFLRVFVGPPATARAHGERAVELAEQSNDRTVEWSAHYGLATLAGLTGDGAGMVRHMERAERLAEELQSPVMRVHTDAMQYAFAAGNWDAGLALAERAIAMARVLNQRALLPRLLTWVTPFYTARGEFDVARKYLDEAWDLGVARAERGRPIEVHTQIAVYAGLASYHLMIGDYARAVEIGEKGLEVADRAGYAVWAIYPLIPITAEAAFYKLDVDRAGRLCDRLQRESERLGHRLGIVWVGAGQGILARLQDDHARAAELIRQSIHDLEQIPWVYDAARLRRWLADVLIRLGDQEGGVRELRKSHETCAALGARVEMERAREMMKLLGIRPPARVAPGDAAGRRASKLTEREMDIARLVMARKSNKEIAAALGLSVRTVTTHVANIFGKLGVSSRGELADRVREGVDALT
jgi:DNA-binding CsgD family transcriptional regulator/tetratricopeptide (TPR) repeat protein